MVKIEEKISRTIWSFLLPSTNDVALFVIFCFVLYLYMVISSCKIAYLLSAVLLNYLTTTTGIMDRNFNSLKHNVSLAITPKY